MIHNLARELLQPTETAFFPSYMCMYIFSDDVIDVCDCVVDLIFYSIGSELIKSYRARRNIMSAKARYMLSQ